jgi:SAM-dependent methyltransferase
VRTIATDASSGLLDVARAKVGRAGRSAEIEFRHVAIERVEDLTAEYGATLDGAFSNFGGLNCVQDLGQVARSMAALLRPGARVVLCVMGPIALWEWAWFLGRGRPDVAFRRLVRGGVTWRGVSVRYPSIRSVRRAFAPQFTLRRAGGVGVLLPPTYAEAWARRHPRLIARLDRWERRIEEWPAMPWLGDHYVVELGRR